MMADFSKQVLDVCEREPEIEFTTYGRESGEPHRVIIWISRDGDRLFVRSGGGMSRDWARNLATHGRGVVHVAGQEFPVTAMHVQDPAEAKKITRAVARKYGAGADGHDRPEDAPPVPAEQATFELFPA